jgi:hypothetical protein
MITTTTATIAIVVRSSPGDAGVEAVVIVELGIDAVALVLLPKDSMLVELVAVEVTPLVG